MFGAITFDNIIFLYVVLDPVLFAARNTVDVFDVYGVGPALSAPTVNDTLNRTAS